MTQCQVWGGVPELTLASHRRQTQEGGSVRLPLW